MCLKSSFIIFIALLLVTVMAKSVNRKSELESLKEMSRNTGAAYLEIFKNEDILKRRREV